MKRQAQRLAWLVLASGALGVLGVASQLAPAPSGHGTHTQLGLPPCGFLLATGMPCPGCGLTTAFAHMMRGAVLEACRAHCAGVGLWALALLAVPTGLLGAWRGWQLGEVSTRLRLTWWLAALVLVALVQWAVRIVLGWG